MTMLIAAFPFADVATLLGVLTPLIVVPLGIITFYLRALREQQKPISLFFLFFLFP